MTLALTSGNTKSCALYTAAAVTATGLNSSDSAPAANFLQCTIQVVWDSITGAAAFKIQSTNGTGGNWDDIPSATGTTSGASGSLSIHLSSLPGTAIRVTLTSAAGAGTLTPTFAMKR